MRREPWAFRADRAAMRRVLPLALLVTAVINGLLVLRILLFELTSGWYWLNYVWLAVNALSAYGCWMAGKHLIHQRAQAAEVERSPGA